ncbi:VOC family protein [Bosea sp. RAF48]|uniref:VOC family protein n=1 Tax=Bosea sp. RAF48 TaxID=3237480 RepID=UPI003F907D42
MTGRGLHHVTAIATDALRNLDFYTRVLGLRLVKRTVTHEDPGAYHLIYGNADGAPGSSLSFFAWLSAAAASERPDGGEHISFAIGPEAVTWWERRLIASGVPFRRERAPGGAPQLSFEDPDHAPLALVASELASAATWSLPDIPPAFALRALRGVSLSIRGTELMTRILTEVLGFAEMRREADWIEFSAHDDAGGWICLHRRNDRQRPRLGAGAIHHVAFRARDEADLAAMSEALKERVGISASPIKDRHYFRSIYFRGPDGLLIEVSTDSPGFLIDETRENLGTRLIFPPGLQDRQEELLRILPPLDQFS